MMAVPLSSCARFYAGLVSSKLVSDQLAMESYRGRYVEHYALAEGGDQRARVVKEVLFQEPWSVRVEVLEPAEHAGELVVYDGESLSMWFPRERVGVRIEGAEAPSPAEIRRMLTDDTLWAWQSYAFSYRGQGEHQGRRVGLWKASPSRRQELLFPYRAWTDLEYSLPLRVEINDGPEHPWYSMAFEQIEFDQPVPAGAFDFAFPEDATVLALDLRAPGIPEHELREQLDFPLLVPERLPEGLSVRRMIKGQAGLPVAALLMDEGGRWLSLTETHAFGRALEPGAGIPISVGEEPGFLNLVGSFSSVSWYAGRTALTLVGNLPYPEMVKLAASIEAPEGAGPADMLALQGYRGRLVERCESCPHPEVLKRLRYQAPGRIEVEVLEPAERAGERFVYDGETVAMIWPDEGLALRIRGAEAPTVDQLRQLLREDGAWALRNFSHSWEGQAEQAGRAASHWRSQPRAEGLRPYQTWLDRDTAIPLKWVVGEEERPWFSTELSELSLGADPEPIAIDLPEDLLVIDWDLGAAGVSLESAQAALNFDLLLPGELPDGLAVERILPHPELPMATVMMGRGARWLSLTESRHFGGPPLARSGIPVEIAGRPARLDLSGSFAALSWSLGGTALTLVGNLPYQELVRVAASVRPAEGGLEVRDLLALEGYRARSVESYAGSGAVEKRILQAGGKLRVEVLSPGSRAGELFLYDGESLVMWWPRHLVGVRIGGVEPPDEARLRAGLGQGALWALRSYDLTFEGLAERAGRAAEHWSAAPRPQEAASTAGGAALSRADAGAGGSNDAGLDRLWPVQAWLDRETSLPLAVQMEDGEGGSWYTMELRGLELEPEVEQGSFAFRFPRNAVVFDWDLRDPHLPLAELAPQMNFTLRAPTDLPEGFELRRAVKGRHMLPMALLQFDDGQRWLTLSQARRVPGAMDRGAGISVRVGEHPGVLVFAGAFSSLSWIQGDATLTLVGDLPYPELLAVAASVEPVSKPVARR